MGKVLLTLWIHVQMTTQQMHWEQKNMQPYELRRRQRPRNLLHFPEGNCASEILRKCTKYKWKRRTPKSRRKVQSTRVQYNTIQYNSLFTFLFLHINTVKKNPIMATVKFDRQGLLFLLCLGYIEEWFKQTNSEIWP